MLVLPIVAAFGVPWFDRENRTARIRLPLEGAAEAPSPGMSFDPTVDGLREALVLSPDNLPLRRLLANALLERGYAAQAEAEFRKGLAQAAGDPELSLGLATAFHVQGKLGEAFVVAEELALGGPVRAGLRAARAAASGRRRPGGRCEGLPVREGVRPVGRGRGAGRRARRRPRLRRRGRAPGGVARSPRGRSRPRGRDRGRAAQDHVRGRRRHGGAQGRDPDEDHPPADPSGAVRGLRQGDRRRHPALRPARVRQDVPGARDGRARSTRGSWRSASTTCWTCGSATASGTCTSCSSRPPEHAPCVLFFDEVDALAASRADMRRSGGRQLINQFLAEMDGDRVGNEGVLILAATNAPWHLDPAFRRPGRFDRILFVPPPDAAGAGRDPPRCSAGASRWRTSTSSTWRRRRTSSPAPT